MPETCDVCGRPLRRGRGGNRGSCVVCPAKICTTCARYGFCPTHYRALSPHGQIVVKRAYIAHLILILPIFFLIFFLGLSQMLSNIDNFPAVFIVLWTVGAYLAVFGFIAVHKVWVRSFWRRDSVSPTSLPASWHCEACGFENPAITQTCGQCGRNKSASLRIG